MTRQTNARVAGFAYLFYIAVAFPSFALFSRASAGSGIPVKLASIAQHTADIRLSMILSFLSAFCALILAVTLYAITRNEDPELAMFGLVCRVGEGVLNAIILLDAGLLWLATATGPNVPDAAGANAIAAFLFRAGSWQQASGATLFAAGSTAFCYLLQRGRMVPLPLAWLGVVGSGVVLIGVPLELIEVLRGPVTQLMWLPIALFEVSVAVWFLIKGVAPLAI